MATELAEEMLQKLERQARGMLPPDSVLDAASLPILDQLPAFLADVESRGRSINTIKAYRKCIPNLCRSCGWIYFADMSSESFEVFRVNATKPKAHELRQASAQVLNQNRRKSTNPPMPPKVIRNGLALSRIGHLEIGHLEKVSPKYLNDLLGYTRAFVHWCIRRRLLQDDPLKYVQNAVVRKGRGYRRAFTHQEFRHFLSVAPAHRAAVYRTAYYLGLRRWELNRLKVGDFYPDANPPVVRLPDTITKNGKAAEMQLHPDLLPSLRLLLASGRSPFEYALQGRVPNMETWKRDLTKAAICFKDSEGRRLDFHSLRHTFCTHLRLAGVSKRDALAIMRLSSERLLDQVYCDDSQISTGTEITKLPSFLPEDDSHEPSFNGAFAAI